MRKFVNFEKLAKKLQKISEFSQKIANLPQKISKIPTKISEKIRDRLIDNRSDPPD